MSPRTSSPERPRIQTPERASSDFVRLSLQQLLAEIAKKRGISKEQQEEIKKIKIEILKLKNTVHIETEVKLTRLQFDQLIVTSKPADAIQFLRARLNEAQTGVRNGVRESTNEFRNIVGRSAPHERQRRL